MIFVSFHLNLNEVFIIHRRWTRELLTPLQPLFTRSGTFSSPGCRWQGSFNSSNRNRESLNSLLHGPCQLTEARRCLYFNTSQWDSNVINVNKILPNISANRFVLQNDSTDWLQIRPLLLRKIFTRIFSK